MPTPRNNESENDFVNRCIPIVIDDGTAKDGKQATAICHSIYQQSKSKKESALDFIRRIFGFGKNEKD